MASQESKPPHTDRRSEPREEPPRRRRLRDRLEGEGESLHNPALRRHEDLRNPLLLCDDDLRETARALSGIEGFLLAATRILEKQDVTREELSALLQQDVLAKLDTLSDTLTSLHRSLRTIAEKLD